VLVSPPFPSWIGATNEILFEDEEKENGGKEKIEEKVEGNTGV
jgi:hypothetical protein